jgi:hypothetical protein
MRRAVLVLGALALSVSACENLDLAGLDGCSSWSGRRDTSISALNAEMLYVSAGEGSLRIVSRPDLDRVRVRGEACADREDVMDRIRLFVDNDGSGTISVETSIPDDYDAELDLVIEVPDWMSVDVYDSEGNIVIEGVVDALIDDSSGDIDVTDVARDVRIYDGTGHIVVRRVGDDVWLRDSSGEIDVADVVGDFTLTAHSSGSVQYRNIGGTVLLP